MEKIGALYTVGPDLSVSFESGHACCCWWALYGSLRSRFWLIVCEIRADAAKVRLARVLTIRLRHVSCERSNLRAEGWTSAQADEYSCDESRKPAIDAWKRPPDHERVSGKTRSFSFKAKSFWWFNGVTASQQQRKGHLLKDKKAKNPPRDQPPKLRSS
jgi:hypothetical protein